MPVVEKKCPVSKLLKRLVHFAGLPVPFSVKWFGDKPDFRQIDEEKVKRCVEEKLCAVCGKRLGEWAYYIGGDLCAKNALFTDPPMHFACAAESTRLCPYLNGKRTEYRGDDVQASKRAWNVLKRCSFSVHPCVTCG